MFINSILSASWEAYDSKKIQASEDPHVFCPEHIWECNYLFEHIIATVPHLDPLMIMLAIKRASRETMAPRPRHHFVEVVMTSIREREIQLEKILSNASQASVKIQ